MFTRPPILATLAVTTLATATATTAAPARDTTARSPAIHKDLPKSKATLALSKPDLVITPRFAHKDIKGAPGTGFCGMIGGKVIAYFNVTNAGKKFAGESTALLRFTKSGIHHFADIPALLPGQSKLVGYAIPASAWSANQGGNGATAPFQMTADFQTDVDESKEANNKASSYCLGNP